MKMIGRMNQNTEYRRIPDIRQNTAEYGKAPIYWAITLSVFLLVLTVTFCRVGTPAAAQQAPTVTPYPAVVATATASAQQMSAALNAKTQAAQQAEQARAQAAAADAQFQAAQQAANDARAALAAQQIGAASEALGRAESAIAAGQERVNNLAGNVDSLNATINQQAGQIASLMSDNQSLRTDKQTILANYNALQNQIAESEARLSINPVVAILAGVVTLAVIALVIVWRWSRRDPPHIDTTQTAAPAPPLEGEYTVEDEQNF